MRWVEGTFKCFFLRQNCSRAQAILQHRRYKCRYKMTLVNESIKQLNWLRATHKTKYINFFFRGGVGGNIGDSNSDACGVSYLNVILLWCYILISLWCTSIVIWTILYVRNRWTYWLLWKVTELWMWSLCFYNGTAQYTSLDIFHLHRKTKVHFPVKVTAALSTKCWIWITA